MSDETVGLGQEQDQIGRTLVRRGGIEDFARRFDLVKVYRGILRRLWIVIGTAVLFALAAGALSLRLKNTYVADAYLMFEIQSTKYLPQQVPLGHFTMSSATEMVMLPAHLNAVRSILGLDLSEKDLEKMVTVQPPLGDSNLINISVSADNPGLATDIANTLATVVVKDAQDYAKHQLKAAYDYLDSQSQQFNKKIDEISKQIADFRKTHTLIDATPDGVMAARRALDSEKSLQDAIANYNSLLIEYENLRRETARMPDTIVRDTFVDNPLQRRLFQAEIALLEARTRYAAENPKIKVLEAELDELHKMLNKPQTEQTTGKPFKQVEPNLVKQQLNLNLVALRGKVRSAQKIKEDLAASYEKQQKQRENLPAEEMQFSRLLDEKNRYEQDLKDTQAMMKSSDMLLKLNKGDISLYLKANKAQPSENILVELLPLVGFLVGIGFGICLAAFLEILDPKIRTVGELTSSYNLPCLATIPELARLTPSNAEESLKGYISHLEESINRSVQAQDSFTLALTSSVAAEGKSTITYCLARLYQRLGKSVVVVEWDADGSSFFEPHQIASKTIGDYLRGQANIDEIIYRGELCRVTVGKEADLKPLLRKGHLPQLIEELRRQFDIVLFDTPGIEQKEFTLSVLEHAQHALFIIGSIKVTREYVDASLQSCERAGVFPIGLVLNRALRIFIDDIYVQHEGDSAVSSSQSGAKGWFSKK